MIRMENYLGRIELSRDFLVQLVGNTAIHCFGVAGLAPVLPTKRLLGKSSLSDGIRVRCRNNALVIELHILVSYGTNISAIVKSIVNKVRYAVEETTGFSVAAVHVYVDGIKS